MGNDQPSNKTRLKHKNNFSFDVTDLNTYSIDKIKSNNHLETKFDNQNVASSLDLKQSLGKLDHMSAPSMPSINKIHSSSIVDSGRSKMLLKEQNAKLQKLTKNNDQLRKQLISINKQLSQQLQKKKMPILMNQHNKSSQKSSNKQQPSQKQQSKNKMKKIALKKQLQNAYNQINMYKKQILQFKKTQTSKPNEQRLQQYQDKVSAINIQIQKTKIQVDSTKSVVDKQSTVIKQFEQEMNGKQVEDSKKQIAELKERLKVLKNVSRKKEKEEKMRHQILIQLERKLREINGEYLPQFKNYSQMPQQTKSGDKSRIVIDKKKIKISQSSPSSKQQKQFRYLPSKLQIQEVQIQIKKLKQNHEQFHKKIDQSMKKRNDLKEERKNIQQKLISIQKNIQNFNYKKDRYMQLIMGNISANGEASNMDDLFSVMDEGQGNEHANGIRMNEGFNGGIIIKGQDLEGQIQFSDKGNIKDYQKIIDNLKIITINIWMNDNAHIVGIQFFYTDGKQFYLGKRSRENQQVQEKMTFQLEEGDYLKNIMGTFNKKTKYLEFLVFESMKGKILKCGKQSFKNNNFNIRTGKSQRPAAINGACLHDGNFWRINKLEFVIKK